ncbi:sigma-54 dependent transcriptional regulator [Bacillus subtilis]|jgi:two-component system nitrogen regulation response regulator NtrX|uniref:nitrogen assimilation response regulator NtrX n=1 Tax=Pseudochrobactrum asaccharolyticum TaxID=354351 RepID=UPI000EFADA75|nr:sigma-54 dependent transcriptional regulator [Pseudochrobactrum asaccharolyticum]MBX8801366.1 sigma-54-dependent Fis family transcriptional regulator [Ochrobactrum sp. MR28]MBX8817376.1 sigma-54-dependent Fis family transcriptional regulator [Ochrobactrum sp. MR31]MCF7671330.1 sigma-54 dependent transcriptional regulator [Bacillus subtilis]MDR2312293.1 sigma-54 dependent transcriptional regulator [Brucellaceae bacterium]MCF7645605.1 sigma-54 dependent transcriptional regulator [Pseudochroba
MASDILVVDDETDIRDLVAGILSDEGHETRTAFDSDSALAAINDRVPRLIFLDIWLQGSRLDGLALLDEIKKLHPDLPVVMISGHGNIETAVSAIRRGAYDFIEKPFKADRLILVAERALETSNLKREVSNLRKRSGDSFELLGNSLAMNQLRQTIERVAPTNSRIMITGPSGSGKEMAARAIHALSSRANGPFVTVNAATITPERMEIELFGTEMDGGERKVGALEEAHGGILYLDEIADMPRETQNKILRVLVDQQFERVGGTKRVKVDVRIISSTAQNLEGMIAEGLFREDLFHRLAVVPVQVPPLAQRRDDIPSLVSFFINQVAEQAGIKPRRISDDAMAVLQSHSWPGNVRQLRNNVERLMILARGDDVDEPVTADLLPAEIGDTLPRTPTDSDQHIMALPLREAREMFEKEYLVAQINRFSGNISRTAEFVGMERSALHRKLKSLGV